MRTKQRKGKIKAFYTTLSMVLSLTVLLTMMPLTPVYAETSTEYKAKMDAAQQKVEQYTAQLATDQAALDAATTNLDSATETLNAAADAFDKAEDALDQKSSDYIYQKIIDAWPNDVARLKALDDYTYSYYNDKISNFDSQGYIMYSDDYLIEDLNASGSSLIKTILSDYNSKYGEGSFKRALVATQGYFNTLEALDNIDRCNEIRASRTELAKFFVDVLGESVPNNVQQLRISPYLMKSSAVNVTLNLDGKCDHIYRNNGLCGASARGQNVVSGKYSTDGEKVEPFEAWWNKENEQHMTMHNKTLSSPDYTLTGLSIANSNKVTGGSFSGQDFIAPAKSGFVSYSVEEYRNGLKAYCASELAAYNEKDEAYTAVSPAYRAAKSEYDTAKAAYDNTAKLLNNAKAEYDRYKKLYEDALESEQNTTYTIKFYDGRDGTLLMQKTVVKGSYVEPPTPPTHEGYKFVGWDSDIYKNVTRNYSIQAIYEESGSTGDSTIYYTVIFKDGVDHKTLSTQSIESGKNAVPPAAPNHDGYVFVGWDSQYKNITSNKTITAVYDKVSSSTKIDLSKSGYVKASKTSFVYKGKAIRPTAYIIPYVTDRAGVEHRLYPCKVTYKKNNAIGTATIIFSPPTDPENAAFANQFTGNITYTFKIVPAKPGFSKVKMATTKATVTLKKVSGGCSYQYQIRKKGTTKWTSKKSAKTTVTLKQLKKNKKYQLRIRAYKKVNGKTYYSKWNTVTVKTTQSGTKTYKY